MVKRSKSSEAEKLPTITYKARPGFGLTHTEAETFGPILDQIKERDGLVRPEMLVEEAKNPRHPMHGKFTWDKNKAAHMWNLEEARHIIKGVMVFSHQLEWSTPAFWNVQSGNERGYTDVDTVLNTKEYLDQQTIKALSELDGWAKKYAIFSALEPIVRGVRELLGPKLSK